MASSCYHQVNSFTKDNSHPVSKHKTLMRNIFTNDYLHAHTNLTVINYQWMLHNAVWVRHCNTTDQLSAFVCTILHQFTWSCTRRHTVFVDSVNQLAIISHHKSANSCVILLHTPLTETSPINATICFNGRSQSKPELANSPVSFLHFVPGTRTSQQQMEIMSSQVKCMNVHSFH